jgi:hypothetical protein
MPTAMPYTKRVLVCSISQMQATSCSKVAPSKCIRITLPTLLAESTTNPSFTPSLEVHNGWTLLNRVESWRRHDLAATRKRHQEYFEAASFSRTRVFVRDIAELHLVEVGVDSSFIKSSLPSLVIVRTNFEIEFQNRNTITLLSRLRRHTSFVLFCF